MARVIQFHKIGGPEVLQIDEVDTSIAAVPRVLAGRQSFSYRATTTRRILGRNRTFCHCCHRQRDLRSCQASPAPIVSAPMTAQEPCAISTGFR
jgi:hypothetical protein